MEARNNAVKEKFISLILLAVAASSIFCSGKEVYDAMFSYFGGQSYDYFAESNNYLASSYIINIFFYVVIISFPTYAIYSALNFTLLEKLFASALLFATFLHIGFRFNSLFVFSEYAAFDFAWALIAFTFPLVSYFYFRPNFHPITSSLYSLSVSIALIGGVNLTSLIFTRNTEHTIRIEMPSAMGGTFEHYIAQGVNKSLGDISNIFGYAKDIEFRLNARSEKWYDIAVFATSNCFHNFDIEKVVGNKPLFTMTDIKALAIKGGSNGASYWATSSGLSFSTPRRDVEAIQRYQVPEVSATVNLQHVESNDFITAEAKGEIYIHVSTNALQLVNSEDGLPSGKLAIEIDGYDIDLFSQSPGVETTDYSSSCKVTEDAEYSSGYQGVMVAISPMMVGGTAGQVERFIGYGNDVTLSANMVNSKSLSAYRVDLAKKLDFVVQEARLSFNREDIQVGRGRIRVAGRFNIEWLSDMMFLSGTAHASEFNGNSLRVSRWDTLPDVMKAGVFALYGWMLLLVLRHLYATRCLFSKGSRYPLGR